MSKQGKNALLRVCASCEWIFIIDKNDDFTSCPKCGFGHYSARHVYGNRAYTFSISQKPWIDRKVNSYRYTLLNEVDKTNPIKKKREDLFRGIDGE